MALPLRKPRVGVDLVEFLEGILAVLAFRGRRTLEAQRGAFARALAETVDVMRPMADRYKVTLSFRVRSDSALVGRSTLAQALKRLQVDGVVLVSEGQVQIQAGEAAAYVLLEALPAPIQFYERAAKAFLRRYEVARIRAARSSAPEK